MQKSLLVIPVLLFVFGIGYAHAQLDNASIAVFEFEGDSATVQITWNSDMTVAKYEAGCVSCMPNISEFSSEDNSMILNNVTPFPNTSNALLYLIAYDSQDEIIDARQILVDLSE
ncbi:MAG: hypothetical protein ACR2LL_04270 [Nitrosopumilus sp.]|uniref:hypothetical protein n=1 Tax=Nitrosopumilus sp. TaxID=2024843 RepID=UPI0029319FC1|nr:hypothetical protein [Nitrosopumilus sp.]